MTESAAAGGNAGQRAARRRGTAGEEQLLLQRANGGAAAGPTGVSALRLFSRMRCEAPEERRPPAGGTVPLAAAARGGSGKERPAPEDNKTRSEEQDLAPERLATTSEVKF